MHAEKAPDTYRISPPNSKRRLIRPCTNIAGTRGFQEPVLHGTREGNLPILQVQFQTMAVKWILHLSKSHEFFGFPLHIKVIFTLCYSLLSM